MILRNDIQKVILFTMSSTNLISGSVNMDMELVSALYAIEYCTRATILVVGIHDELTPNQGLDSQIVTFPLLRAHLMRFKGHFS